MFEVALDRVRVALGRPTTWERRTKAAVLESYGVIFSGRVRIELLEPSAYRYEPAVVHKPTGWLTVFPMRQQDRRLSWLRNDEGRVTYEAGVLRSGVWMETFIGEPSGMTVAEEFASRTEAARRAGDNLVMQACNPPSADGDTPGELSLSFARNGSRRVLRLLMSSVRGHVVEVAYDTSAHLSQTAFSLADRAFAIGQENVRVSSEQPEIDLKRLCRGAQEPRHVAGRGRRGAAEARGSAGRRSVSGAAARGQATFLNTV